MNKTDIALQRAINRKRLAYRNDPIGFETEVLDIKPSHVWGKMREVAESVRDNQFTAVPAGHSVSKTYGAARIAVWFKTCFEPSTVITTAPSDNQVRNQLWREIHMAYAGGGGNCRHSHWDYLSDQAVLCIRYHCHYTVVYGAGNP